MSPPESPEKPGGFEPDLETMLGEVLRPHELPGEALNRVRAAVEAEWRAAGAEVGRSAPRRPLGAWAAGIAAASLLAIALTWWRPANDGAVVGEILRFDEGGIEVRLSPLHHRMLRAGDPIRVGDQLEVHGSSLVSLQSHGTLRVASGSVLIARSPDAIDLARGRVYVELPHDDPLDATFKLLTRAGAVEHLGTAFEVLSDDRTVRVRVREGEIRWLLAFGPALAVAGTQLSITPAGTLARAEVPTNGPDWTWAEALAPDYQIEGKSLVEFLDEVGRELGCHVEFADAHAREVAVRTILHGSVRVREPREALETIIATTSLTYEFQGAAIRVHSSP